MFDVEKSQKLRDMVLHAALTNPESGSNLLIRHALHEKIKYLLLTMRRLPTCRALAHLTEGTVEKLEVSRTIRVTAAIKEFPSPGQWFRESRVAV
jgi:hypothetical protein